MDDVRWRFVQCRTASTAFVYAVKTTKIFCKPNCPARLARRANVLFFDTPTGALAAGFRPCKRCKPGSDGEIDLPAGQLAAQHAKQIIISSGGQVKWKDVAEQVGLSPRYLFEVFKTVEGATPGAFAARLRQRQVDDDHLGIAKLRGSGARLDLSSDTPADLLGEVDPLERPRAHKLASALDVDLFPTDLSPQSHDSISPGVFPHLYTPLQFPDQPCIGQSEFDDMLAELFPDLTAG